MRTAILVLSFLLFALAAKPLPKVAADDDHDAVLDTDGNKLQTGTKYYILPVNYKGKGGGITVSDRKTDNCQINVGLARSDENKGLPVTFTPSTKKKGSVVHLYADLNIKFANETSSCRSNVWKVDDIDFENRRWFIIANGVEGNPSRKTVTNWFKIEKNGDDYKLRFCPSVCNGDCKFPCKDLGIYDKDAYKMLLDLSEEPLKVKFKKA